MNKKEFLEKFEKFSSAKKRSIALYWNPRTNEIRKKQGTSFNFEPVTYGVVRLEVINRTTKTGKLFLKYLSEN